MTTSARLRDVSLSLTHGVMGAFNVRERVRAAPHRVAARANVNCHPHLASRLASASCGNGSNCSILTSTTPSIFFARRVCCSA